MTTLGNSITLNTLSHTPYPTFQQLLATEPVAWVPAFNMWLVTRYADVTAILKDADTYTMVPPPHSHNPMQDTFGPMMLSIDGPAHKQIRDVFMEPFRPRQVRDWYTDVIQKIATALTLEIAQQETVDLDSAFSDKLAIYTVVAALGLEVNDIERFRDWYADFGAAIGNLSNDPALRARGQATFAKFRALVIDQIETLRDAPNQSILSGIVHAPDNALTTDQIVSNVALTFFGGVETATAMLSNTLWALLKHPDQLAAVRQTPALLNNALEEALRWEAPVQSAMRFPTRDVRIHGVDIAKGDKLYCMLSAANRDPRVFSNPDVFDIQRPNANKHLSFAYGPHFCFGAPLARLEATLGIATLLQHLPAMQLDAARPSQPIGHEFRAPADLWVITNPD